MSYVVFTDTREDSIDYRGQGLGIRGHGKHGVKKNCLRRIFALLCDILLTYSNYNLYETICSDTKRFLVPHFTYLKMILFCNF